ncbi:hypothetical protein QAD02_009573 [Eretmocerus hayati]|uniref:Uncharacterized protein n=1 Tax=Eretmocerus hayati TaxID=131215 RepID=A0ACC2N9T7_9HYME|nr:hypothetical protein QAD02_009573 [Eretmocerus hayati]
MTKDEENSSSDTLERSNLSSLQSDLSSMKKTSEIDSKANLNKTQNCFCKQNLQESTKFQPRSILTTNNNANHVPYSCDCQRFQFNDFQNQVGNDKYEWQRQNWKWPRRCYANKRDKSYDVKSKNRRNSRPEQTFCDKCEGTFQKDSGFHASSENPMKYEWNPNTDNEKAEKIEIYYFDHGNSAYFHTTDLPPILATEKCAEKTYTASTQFWAEIFGYVHIGATFFTTLILQFIRCLLFSLVRPLTVGVVQLIADYFVKPLLSITFNGIIQPILILFYNMATSLRDCCEPLATILGFYTREFAALFRSCRLIEINHHHKNGS